jgi:hypothetical protein
MVFAAKGVRDSGAEGGFHWQAVGSQLSATLDATGSTNHFGTCAESVPNEEQCSLNKNPEQDAEDPSVASGTMNPANPTVPWVTWDEQLNGVKQVFVARLVGSGAAAHFELVNNGAPVSVGANDSTRADITFSGNTPYVSWREDIGGGIEKAFVGHFINPANPTFVLDESDVPLTPTAQADVREPISSSCTANPFNSDGAACQGGAVGTPFLLFTNGTSPRSLFADAYQPDPPITGAASGVSASAATVGGAVNPEGAAVNVSFEFGATTAYGQSTTPQKLAPSDVATPFTATLSGLPAGATIHYRAVAVSDFGTFLGNDQTLTTLPPPAGTANVGRAKVSGKTAIVRIGCTGVPGAQCDVTLRMKATGRRHRVVIVGTTTATLGAGTAQAVRISLNGLGGQLLASRHLLHVKLRVTEAIGSQGSELVSTQTVTFKARKHRHA